MGMFAAWMDRQVLRLLTAKVTLGFSELFFPLWTRCECPVPRWRVLVWPSKGTLELRVLRQSGCSLRVCLQPVICTSIFVPLMTVSCSFLESSVMKTTNSCIIKIKPSFQLLVFQCVFITPLHNERRL